MADKNIRFVELTAVQVRRISETEVARIEQRVVINANRVGMIRPDVIPSDLTGPDGTPIALPAASLLIDGGQITVKGEVAEIEYKIMNDSYVPPKPTKIDRRQ